jgi:hypothetical protein
VTTPAHTETITRAPTVTPGESVRTLGVVASSRIGTSEDLASLLEAAESSYNALLALERTAAAQHGRKYVQARTDARRARSRLELAEFQALLEEQKRALPKLVERTRRVERDLTHAQDAVAAVNAISAALTLFQDIIALFA